ncbi:hypothetical protein SAMN06265365_12395 [Tistlia consotensis]|uniref:DUF7847 domain-containing protein n=1 Tax=Tistlia consotensis USBA 355 TaxID=560819 RepID=A0A1Y6CPF7_9PROT|nr:hypothetical protein [Tistlia consotensis]SMF63920.1 hypothetical protein SAMN05428998_12514 [Tistlia consotensis USBA 355]SNR98226.1 hypothetical protein SAMN06265365_12395 [Tistlia consotensis]
MSEGNAGRSALQILGDGLRLYRRHFRSLVAIMAPPLLLSLVFFLAVPSGPEPDGGEAASLWRSAPLAVLQLLDLFLFLLAPAAVVVAAATAAAGGPPGFRTSYGRAWKAGWKLLGCYLLCWLIVGLGWLFFALPGLVAAVYLAFALPSVAVEGQGPWRALRRSAGLVSGRFWPTAGRLLLYLLLFFVTGLSLNLLLAGVASLLGFPEPLLVMIWRGGDAVATASGFSAQFLQSAAVGNVVNTLVSLLLLPAFLVLLVLLYLDLRIRKEGLDQATLAAELAR